MKRMKLLLTLLLGAIMMLSFFGCGKPKFKLLYDGYGFSSEKTEYAQGETVTAYFSLIATDTDYHFWIDDDVDMEQDYDEQHGYVFTFRMPDHDVTLHKSSRNSMVALEQFNVVFENRVRKADVWVLPQTEENLKSSVWGTATVSGLPQGEESEVHLTKPEEAEAWIVRIIDDEHALYSVNDLKLEDGYWIVFKTENSEFEAVIEVLDRDGSVVSSKEAFTGILGAE